MKVNMMKMYNKNNFHNSTFCLWEEVSFDSIKNYTINYKSKSGSHYIFTEIGVYRISNHWGRAANCRWRLISLSNYKNQNTTVGFAKWQDFHVNDEVSELYYIQVNLENKTVQFFHKDADNYDPKAVLRNGNATSKVIKDIQKILNETSWARHLKYEDFEKLQQEISTALVYTKQNFIDLKKKYI